MKKNNEYIKGKYFSFEAPICSLTSFLRLANEVSRAIDHLEGTNLVSLFPKKCSPIIRIKTKIAYKVKLVTVKFK